MLGIIGNQFKKPKGLLGRLISRFMKKGNFFVYEKLFKEIEIRNTDKVFETLSYFDTMNMADKITCKVLASVALKDNICPAECFFATFNRINSKKEICIYPFNEHEGGKSIHEEEKISFIKNELISI